ncbi:MAG: GDSL-type esterase/lipase family protein [Verrucomicrobiota bacterium]
MQESNHPTSGSQHPRIWHTVLLSILDWAFLAALLVLAAAWLFDPLLLRAGPITITVNANFKPWLAAGVLLAARIAVKIHARRHGLDIRSVMDFLVPRQIVLALLSLCILVGILELILKISDYNVEMAPVIFETTDADGHTERNDGYANPELLWKFNAGKLYGKIVINRLGYRDREIDPAKQPGVMRVICMGDSVTAQGDPPYSQLLHNLLAASPPTSNRWEAFNMAVYGYSSAQGLKVFKTQSRQLQPDIVTLYYGWNDHWLEIQTDRNRMARKVGRWHGTLYNILKNKRCFMLLFNLIANGHNGRPVRETAGFRVPPDEYTAIMTEFVQDIRAAGARPLLITAPRREVKAGQHKFPETAAKIDFNTVHDKYAELTRQVAAQTGADLLDLHALGAEPEFDRFFSGDGIHFHQQGLQCIAEAIHNKLHMMATEL